MEQSTQMQSIKRSALQGTLSYTLPPPTKMFLESNKGPGPKYDVYRWAGGGAPSHIPSKQLVVTTMPGPQGAEGRTGVMSGPALPAWEEEGCSRTPAREALPGILCSMGPLWLVS